MIHCPVLQWELSDPLSCVTVGMLIHIPASVAAENKLIYAPVLQWESTGQLACVAAGNRLNYVSMLQSSRNQATDLLACVTAGTPADLLACMTVGKHLIYAPVLHC
jgi:hypothetical protein